VRRAQMVALGYLRGHPTPVAGVSPLHRASIVFIHRRGREPRRGREGLPGPRTLLDRRIDVDRLGLRLRRCRRDSLREDFNAGSVGGGDGRA
jgi:hypothetical protein